FPTAGTYDLDFLFAEGSGGSSIELYYAKGAFFDEVQTTTWQLVGNTAALTPSLPTALANAPDFGDKAWGLHTVHNSGQMLSTISDAVLALQGSAGDHVSNVSVPMLNLIDADEPGV